MIGIVVLGIIAAVAAPAFTDMLNRRRVQAVATGISTDLAYLRAEQSVRPADLIMWVNGDPVGTQVSCYAIGIKSTTSSCDKCWNTTGVCDDDKTLVRAERVPASSQVSFRVWSPDGAVPNFKFAQPRLVPTINNIFFDVCGSSRSSPRAVLRVELSSLGRASVCSPNGSMSGYGTCTIATEPQCPT
ncbi:hypothetical protein SNE35_15075 [Paucibacter sp. R3-3]|uniref:Uncharacterized protein n=1 Tax=Roseateles agri TaxID=3098619 RepID=A0ABU5DHS7_9BURK|nr:hypothetical protein [Paucibacter sp. R3-3]MDY0745841.1 hypothetical protein [Paucibacter sp. R3-3]